MSCTWISPDLFIAAIAALEDLIVATRDIGEFVDAGVPVFDPRPSILHARGKETPLTAPASAKAVAEVIRDVRRGQ